METATRPEDTRQLLEGLGLAPTPDWMNTTEVGDDGYLVAMPVDEKLKDELVYAEECEGAAEAYERAGDLARGLFERRQAAGARERAGGCAPRLTTPPSKVSRIRSS